jgi:peroxiredoxin
LSNLIGLKFPDLHMPSTNGEQINLGGRTVVVFYPYTGRADHPDPPGWDQIEGAHGSTPQLLAFSAACQMFQTLQVSIRGISFQTTAWQGEFVARNKLQFPLLSDADRHLTNVMSLQTFRAGESDYLTRRTLIVNSGIVTHDFYPISAPEQNAQDVLKQLQS